MVKIIVTYGPAVRSRLDEVKAAGGDRLVPLVRLTMAHGTRAEQQDAIQKIFAADLEPVVDLSGKRKARTGPLAGMPLQLHDGQALLASGHPGASDDGVIALPYEVACQLVEGQTFNIEDANDGHLIQFVVEEKLDEALAHVRVERGGKLGANKAIYGFPLEGSVLAEKDLNDLAFALDLGVRKIIPSFIMSKVDLDEVYAHLKRLGASDVEVIPKIEHPEALPQVPEILREVRRFVLGRGDYFRHLSRPAQLFRDVKVILNLAREIRVEAIVATAYMKDVARTGELSQSDIIDVAFAIQEGAQIILLTNETAMAEHPILAVRALTGILERVREAL